jgi:ketosteroid isomerase-like protein
MATKHSGSETFLLVILLLVCLGLVLVYYVWYGVTANSSVAQIPTFTPTIAPVEASVTAALETATSQAATAAAIQPTITPTNTPRPLRDQLTDIIVMEADASKQADVNKALSLYAPDAEIIDAASGTKWVGLNQIRSRYVDDFGMHKYLENNDEFIDLKQDSPISATVWVTQTGTVSNLSGGTPFPTPANRESWQFVKLNEGWKIKVFTYFLPTYYTIQNFHSHLCLEQHTNLAVVQDDCTGRPSTQWWQFSPTDDKNFQRIVNKNSMCMDIDGNAGEADGIILRPCNPNSETQLWRLELYDHYITIVSKHRDPNKPEIPKFCVDVQQFKPDLKEQMIYFDCNQKHNFRDNANQLWLVTEVQQ